jgi:hypothetical protein
VVERRLGSGVSMENRKLSHPRQMMSWTAGVGWSAGRRSVRAVERRLVAQSCVYQVGQLKKEAKTQARGSCEIVVVI